MTEELTGKVLRLRLTIGALGERCRPAWWSTQFSDPTALAFLSPVVPRSVAAARYHGMVAAARLVHDEHLSAGCFHLFRLPEETEQDLHQLALRLESESWSRWVDSTDQALDWLRETAARSRADGDGPVLISGAVDDLSDAMLASVGSVYTRAFLNQSKAYPYWTR